jgi:Xaa-Pro aminopeptidase
VSTGAPPATAAGERADRLAALAAERELDLLVVGDLVRPGDSSPDARASLRWLTGFTGTSGLAIVGPETRTFVTDFRYVERAAREVDSRFDRVTAERQLLPALKGLLRGRVGFDDASTSVANLRKLEEELEGVELVAAGGLVERLRRVKDAVEQEAIAAAASLADEVYGSVLERGLAGRTEREVARDAEARIREMGVEPAFPVIVAAGPNGALPHAEPGDRPIVRGELVVFDMGAQLDGYCSDCTRTFAAGEVGGEEREVYELVRVAQAEALEGIRPGVGGAEADAIARERIAAAGHGDHFGHGLGHGVGLEIHEAPRLGQRSEDVLAAGEVVTVEPGVYVPKRFGVRIEDLVVVTETGLRNLSSLPKELRVVEG